MLAGLRADPEDFEALSADFDRLLDRIVIAESDYELSEAAPVAQTCRVDSGEIALASSGAPNALKARTGKKARKEQPSQGKRRHSSLRMSQRERQPARQPSPVRRPSRQRRPTASPPVGPAPVGAAPSEGSSGRRPRFLISTRFDGGKRQPSRVSISDGERRGREIAPSASLFRESPCGAARALN